MTTTTSPIPLGLVCAGAALLSLVLVETVRRFKVRIGKYDRVSERSSHVRPTPRGGGIGIVTAVSLGILVLRVEEAYPLLAGALLIAAISYLDDLRPLSAAVRFPVHVVAAVLVVLTVGFWTSLSGLAIGAAGIPVTVLWIVAVTNIYNFMDGIDGIAGAQAIAAGAAWFFMDAGAASTLGALLAAAAAGFLVRNWPPAKIFMGDVGSAFLGFMFASLPLLSPRRDTLFLPAILALWPFLADGTLTIVRRAMRRENIFAAHRSHIYQRMVIGGRSHAFVTALYFVLAAIGGVIAVWLTQAVWRT